MHLLTYLNGPDTDNLNEKILSAALQLEDIDERGRNESESLSDPTDQETMTMADGGRPTWGR